MKNLFLLFCILFFAPSCKKSSPLGERCKLDPDPGLCKAYILKYYYDKQEEKCKSFVWGGCGGVVPFDSEAECKEQCACK